MLASGLWANYRKRFYSLGLCDRRQAGPEACSWYRVDDEFYIERNAGARQSETCPVSDSSTFLRSVSFEKKNSWTYVREKFTIYKFQN